MVQLTSRRSSEAYRGAPDEPGLEAGAGRGLTRTSGGACKFKYLIIKIFFLNLFIHLAVSGLSCPMACEI